MLIAYCKYQQQNRIMTVILVEFERPNFAVIHYKSSQDYFKSFSFRHRNIFFNVKLKFSSFLRLTCLLVCSEGKVFLFQDNLAQPQMMVVSDIDDVFVPLVDGFLVDVTKARLIIDR